MRYLLENTDSTKTFGSQIAKRLVMPTDKPVIIHLSGDLGRGKTTFVQGFIKALGYLGLVKSPTYAIVEPYEELSPKVYHFDLYRLAAPDELEYVGVRDYLSADNILIFEWPEKAEGVVPPADLLLEFDLDGNGRQVSMTVVTEGIIADE